MNKKERKRIKTIRDELEIMMESEKKKKDNLFKIGASMERVEQITRAVVGLEIATSVLGDLVT